MTRGNIQSVPDAREPLSGLAVGQELRKRYKWRRRGVGATIAVGAVMLGTGIAAATGALSPSAVSANINQALTPAQSIVGSADPLAVLGAVVQLTAAGPEGTVIKVITDEGNDNALAAGSCATLTVTTANAPSAPADMGGCYFAGATSLGSPLSSSEQEQASLGPLWETAIWKSPTGQVYTIGFGHASSGTGSVALTNGQGNVASEVQPVDGWYAIYLTSSEFDTFDYLELLNSVGQLISSQPLGPSFS